MKRIITLSITFLIAVNLVAPTIDMAAEFSCGSTSLALASQPIMQYYAAVAALPIKIVTSFLFGSAPGHASPVSSDHRKKQDGSAAARASSQFSVVSASEKLRMQKTPPGTEEPLCAVPLTASSWYLWAAVMLLLALRSRGDFWRYIRSLFIRRIMMPRGSLDYAACMHILFNGKPGPCFQWPGFSFGGNTHVSSGQN